MPARGRLVVLCLVLACGTAASAAHQAASPPVPKLTPDEMEAFLLKARIIDVDGIGKGVTNAQRAQLSDGRITHDAQIQSVDVQKPLFEAGRASEVNFKDSYRFNIAGYRLARLLGLSNVPTSVEREVNGKMSAVTWWVDDVQMDEKERVRRKTAGPNPTRTAYQLQTMKVWDELIQNRDRNAGNMLWANDWTLWMIDHTRAFRLGEDLLNTDGLTRCERGLLSRLRAMTEQSLATAVGDSLSKDEQKAIMIRRGLLLKHFDARIRQHGEAVVLFSM